MLSFQLVLVALALLPFALANPLLPAFPPLLTRQTGSCATAPCPIGLCCSQYDYCGTGSLYCQAGSCAGGVGGTCSGAGECCSIYGYCGTGPAYCGTPTTTPTPTPTPTPTGTCANQWNQCAGEGWTGAHCCVPPYKCVYGGVWFSQCE